MIQRACDAGSFKEAETTRALVIQYRNPARSILKLKFFSMLSRKFRITPDIEGTQGIVRTQPCLDCGPWHGCKYSMIVPNTITHLYLLALDSKYSNDNFYH